MKKGLSFGTVKYLFAGLYIVLLGVIFGRLMIDSKSSVLPFVIIAASFAAALVLAFLPMSTVKIGFSSRRLPTVIALIVFSLMAAVLLIGINLAPAEYFGGAYEKIINVFMSDRWFLPVLIGVWALAAVVGIALNLGKDPAVVYKRYLAALLAGSVLELLISVPLHLIISRRQGCFVGLTSMAGVSAGLLVLLWALGPGLFLFALYLYNKRKNG